MAGLHPPLKDGRVNGLQRPSARRGRHLQIARRHPVSLIVMGLCLYVVAMLFPLALREVSSEVFGVAVVGTGLLIAGLHVRWTEPADSAN